MIDVTPINSDPSANGLLLANNNGKDFARLKKITRTLLADFYFAYPHSSREHGSNENTQLLWRRFGPNFQVSQYFSDVNEKRAALKFMEEVGRSSAAAAQC